MSPEIATFLRPGLRVALGDGLGSPRTLAGPLSDAARECGGVRLLLGWTPVGDDPEKPALDPIAFADVRTVMPGWGLRSAVDAGLVHAPPVRLSTVPSLMAGPLRPDLLLATVAPHPAGGYAFTTEVSWQRAAVAAGARVLALLAPAGPRADAGPPLPPDSVHVLAESDAPHSVVAFTAPTPVHRAIAGHVAELVSRVAAVSDEPVRLQIGPGALGSAVVDAIETPVALDSGLLPDAAVALDRRGLLRGTPVATYLAGGRELLEWADGRALLHPVEHTHDLGRLSSGAPLVAVNTALELDEQGQVNVEGSARSVIGGVGGHPDYAVAGARSLRGLSVVALAGAHRGRSTLVRTLSRPVTTPGHDVDVVVTEHGAVDLRGLDRPERATALGELWAAPADAALDRSPDPAADPVR
jgi:acyl-CoA hydrolase